MSSAEQVIYEYGEPRYYCMGCDHYHARAGGCPVMDEPRYPFVIDRGRYWPGKAGS